MENNEEYNNWVKTFYEGSFPFKGWNSRKTEVLAAMQQEKEEAETLLDEIGKLVGNEWARDNDVRKINTADLTSWGAELKASLSQTDREIIEALQKMKDEVLNRVGFEKPGKS